MILCKREKHWKKTKLKKPFSEQRMPFALPLDYALIHCVLKYLLILLYCLLYNINIFCYSINKKTLESGNKPTVSDSASSSCHTNYFRYIYTYKCI